MSDDATEVTLERLRMEAAALKRGVASLMASRKVWKRRAKTYRDQVKRMRGLLVDAEAQLRNEEAA